jgi:hypothetical protein
MVAGFLIVPRWSLLENYDFPHTAAEVPFSAVRRVGGLSSDRINARPAALADVPGIGQALVELSEAVCRSRLGGAMPTTLHTLPRDHVGQHFAEILYREVLAAEPLAHL